MIGGLMVGMGRGIALAVVTVLLGGCGNDEPATTAPSPTASTVPQSTSTESGPGATFDRTTLDEPPNVDGVITAEQAVGVTRTVAEAWIAGDRARAERFVDRPATLDELFAIEPPSDQFVGDDDGDAAYCSGDDTAGYTDCSYSLVDSSPDGVLALGFTVADVDGVVLVISGGVADWND